MKIAHKIIMNGGLGNQLFQLFFAINGCKNISEIEINLSNYSDVNANRKFELKNILSEECVKNFNISRGSILISIVTKFLYFLPISIKKKLKIVSENNLKLSNKGNIIIGYFQSINFIPPRNFIKDYFKNFDKFSVTDKSVGIHIRRGDYLHSSHSIHGVIPLEKLLEQLRILINNEYNVSDVYFFSDSDVKDELTKKINNNIKIKFEKFIYVPDLGLSDSDEFLLMREMSFLICSNSTYSWWAAFSSQKNERTFLPRQWYLKRKIPEDLIFPNVVIYD